MNLSINTATATAQWLKKRQILSHFPVGWRRLCDWSLSGIVRTVKLNGSKSGARLYYSPDIEDALLSISAGRDPKIKQGRLAR